MPGTKKPRRSSGKRSPAKQANSSQRGGRGGKRKTSWKKGQSGNPHGRPKKGETFSDIIRSQALVRDIGTASGKRIRRKQAIVEKLYSKAIQEGDFSSIKYLIDRVDPPPGTEPPGEEQTAAQVWQAVIAMVRRATEKYPAVRAKIVKELEAASTQD